MNADGLRVDKWLWAARFFKTRSLAAKAVEAGHVRVNGAAAKPARTVQRGDEIALRKDGLEWIVEVRALARHRGPAAEAALLYQEGEESRARREAEAAKRRVELHPAAEIKGRPTKKDRRLIHRFTGS